MAYDDAEITLTKRSRRFVWTLAFFGLGLVLCEVCVRVAGLVPTPTFTTDGRTTQRVDDPTLLFENLPNAVQRVHYFAADGTRKRTVLHEVNAQGFRGPLVAQPKPAGTFRIACVGDSHTFGFGVESHAAWPAQLARLLNENGAPIEVINCGVNAYDTLQEALWLERHVMSYEPDLVLLQYFVNDAWARNVGNQQAPVQRDWLLDLSHPRREGWVRALRDVSAAADLVLDGIFRRRNVEAYSTNRISAYAEGSPGWIRSRAALLRMRAYVEEQGGSFAVVLFPFMHRVDEHFTSHAAFQIVRAFCEQHEVVVYDAAPAFGNESNAVLRVSEHDNHASARAHELFARGVAGFLERERLCVSND